MSNELEEKFGKAQEALIERFKIKLKDAAEDVLGTLYSDTANFASSDAHINYHNYLRDEFKESMIKEITTEYTHYSWAHGIRMEILKQHPEVLRNKIIEDLEGRIKQLQDALNQRSSRDW